MFGSFACPPSAQSDLRTEARRALEAVGTLSNLRSATEEGLDQQILQYAEKEPERALMLAKIKPKLMAKLTELLPELEAAIVDIYTAEFTAAELRSIAMFYQSPAGRKLKDGGRVEAKVQQELKPMMEKVMASMFAEALVHSGKLK